MLLLALNMFEVFSETEEIPLFRARQDAVSCRKGRRNHGYHTVVVRRCRQSIQGEEDDSIDVKKQARKLRTAQARKDSSEAKKNLSFFLPFVSKVLVFKEQVEMMAVVDTSLSMRDRTSGWASTKKKNNVRKIKGKGKKIKTRKMMMVLMNGPMEQ